MLLYDVEGLGTMRVAEDFTAADGANSFLSHQPSSGAAYGGSAQNQ